MTQDSSSWLRFHFADIRPCVSAKYILFLELIQCISDYYVMRQRGEVAGRGGGERGAGGSRRAGRQSSRVGLRGMPPPIQPPFLIGGPKVRVRRGPRVQAVSEGILRLGAKPPSPGLVQGEGCGRLRGRRAGNRLEGVGLRDRPCPLQRQLPVQPAL